MIQLDMYGLKLKIFKPYNKIQIFVIKIFEMHTPFLKYVTFHIKPRSDIDARRGCGAFRQIAFRQVAFRQFF